MTEKHYVGCDVSIIVPLFHGGRYLENILQMTKMNIESADGISTELVLVNDSPEDVPDFSVSASFGLSPVIVLNEKNLGIQRARLEGMERAKGSYLFFLDQDDEIANDAIIKLYRAVQGGELSVSDWTNELFRNNSVHSIMRIANVDSFSFRRFCRGGNVIGPPGHCLIRRDCIPRCWKNRIMKVNGADDVLLWMGILAEGHHFTHCNENLYTHKLHQKNFSNDVPNMLISEEEAFRLAAEEYGISAFWSRIHRRNIKYRERIFQTEKLGGSAFRKRLWLLLYPEILLFFVLDKLGIYV